MPRFAFLNEIKLIICNCWLVSFTVNNGDSFVRILVDPVESERLQIGLKPGVKLVPQGLKFAFVGNDTTDWTVYADTLVPLEEKAPTKVVPNSPTKNADKDVKK